MDNYELVLDIIEHPQNYTDKQVVEILSDPECREIYNLIVKVDSAFNSQQTINVDDEWEKFKKLRVATQRRFILFRPFKSRAAAIIACTSASLVAAAIGITISVTRLTQRPQKNKVAIEQTISTAQTIAPVAPTIELSDTLTAGVIVFENETLEHILTEVASVYKKELKINNIQTAELRLFFNFDSTVDLEKVLLQINTFEQINVKLIDDTIILE